MRRKYLDLILIVIIAAINIAWTLRPMYIPALGVILALPLVFLLPGYALTDILSYKLPLKNIYRFIFSLGLSLTIDIIGGFILNFLPAGLQATSWTVLLGLLTTLFALLAAFLRRKQAQGEAQSVRSRLRLRFPEYILIGLSILLVILAIQYSVNQVAQTPARTTQLWLLPPTPRTTTCAVLVGVQSFEATTTTYHVTLALNNVQVYSWQPVLVPQQAWNQEVSLVPKDTNSIYVEVKLYRADQPIVVYREVHMTLHPVQANNAGIIHC